MNSTSPCFCTILLWCDDLPLWGSVQFRDQPLGPNSQSFPPAIPLLYLTVYWYFWTFLCICTLKLKFDLLQEGQLRSSATALATLASLGCCNTAASLQLFKFLKLERSWWECEWYLGFCRGSGQEVVPLLGKSLMQMVPTRHVILPILKGFTFSWRSLGCQATYELWPVSAGNEQEPLLLVTWISAHNLWSSAVDLKNTVLNLILHIFNMLWYKFSNFF